MPEPAIAETALLYGAEAEADMRDLGLDPTVLDNWKLYALVLLRDRRLLVGQSKPGDEEIVEISKASHARLMRVARVAAPLIAKLKEIEAKYLAIEQPTQRDALEHAIAGLVLLEDGLDRFNISEAGGLPSPLRLVLADLINVLEGRLGRLVSPPDEVVAGAKGVPDSARDRIRLTIHAYAASTIARLISSGTVSSNEEAYRRVAEALKKAGFHAPGKANPVSKETVRSWYESALTDACPFADEYRQALQAAEAPPGLLLEALQRTVRSLMFTRDAPTDDRSS